MLSSRSRSFTYRFLTVLLVAALAQVACAAVGKLKLTPELPTAVPVGALPVETAAAPEPTAPITATEAPLPAAAPTESATEAPTLPPVAEIPEGISFDYQPTPLGTALEVETGGRKLSIAVQRVILGKDADAIALARAPEEMQWVVIQLKVYYLEGEKDVRAQLFDSGWFHIVSHGHIDTSQPFLTFVPSPRVDDIRILPGEHSLGYLAFQFYRDDPAPLLRIDLDEKAYFFGLTGEWTRKVEPDVDITLAPASGAGSVDQPVAVGSGAYVERGGVVYQVTVNKVLRGFQAWKKIGDNFGFNEEPPQGQEYVMPYLSVRVARTAREITDFSSGSFSSASKGENLSTPSNFFCPLPCFTSATLYPGGTASGWLPLLAYKDDAAPLMVFGGAVHFQLAGAGGELGGFSPDAISYSNRDAIQPYLELAQTGPVNAIAFPPSDAYLVTGGDDKLMHIWDPAAGSELNRLEGHKGSIRKLAFSADGSRLASLSNTGELILWDTQSWQALHTLALTGTGLGLKFLPSGELLSADQAGTLQIWDVEGGKAVRKESIPRNMATVCSSAAVVSFDASADGAVFAAALSCGYGVIWEPGKPGILFSDANHQGELMQRGFPPPTTGKIVLSPDGKMAAYGSVYYPNRHLTLFDVIDVQAKEVVAGVNPIDLNVVAAKIAPNNDLVIAGVGNKVTLWWPEAFVWGGTNLRQLSGHQVIVTVVEYSSSGEILATGDYSGKIILWKAK